MKNNTGARIAKRGAAFLVAAVLGISANTLEAQAAVHPTNIAIVEDESTVKDQRESEVKSVVRHIRKYDTETVAKCIELSNYLNAYDFDTYSYTNTTPREITSLDIDEIYNEYLYATSEESQFTADFINERLNDKPAIDATIQFCTGMVSNNIKNSICNIFYNALADEELTSKPEVYFRGDTIYVVAKTAHGTKVFEVNGLAVPGVYETVTDLEARYKMVVKNLRGDSEKYPNAIAYNGSEVTSGESVWLSLGDSDIKEVLERGINIADTLKNDPTITVETNDWDYEYLSESELEFLSKNGIDTDTLPDIIKYHAYMTTELDNTFNFR